MAMASILIGFLTGMVTFVVSLVTGQGFLISAGLYVLGGLGGMALVMVLVGLRLALARFDSAATGMVTARH